MKTLYEAYDRDDEPLGEFAGVTLDDLYRIETTFQTNVFVYKLVKLDAEDGKSTAELVRRSICKYPETMYLNLHETHVLFIQDVRMYCNCRKCGESLWKEASMLRRHERTCTGCVHRVYPGGVYHSTPLVFEGLDDENICVAESLRYYPYRATFDFECWFDTEQLPSDSDKVQWVARHVPLSVSVASNEPGHKQVQCLVTDGDTNKLVSAMMDILRAMSDAAHDKIKYSYEDVLEQLAEALTNWDEKEEAGRLAVDKESRPPTNPYKKLMGQFYGWMHQLPAIGFNSGKYDLNAIKQFLIPYFLSTSKTGEQEEQEEQDDKEEENERAGTVFGLIECDLCVPEALRELFADMQPVFKNIRLIRDDLGPFVRRYAVEHNIMATPRRMLLGSYRGDKILFATPLLRWYMDHGLEVTHVYQVVEYDLIPCFRRFGDAVSTARREGDVHSHKAITADTMKLLGPRVTERPPPTWTDILTSTTARKRRHRSWSTIDDVDNSTSSSTMRTR